MEFVKGTKYGKLEVLESFPDESNKILVRCECGTEKKVGAYPLKAGSIRSCGCSKKGEDVTGKRFGKLVVVSDLGREKSGRLVSCRCDCGHLGSFSLNNLRSGRTQSCGCGNGGTDLVDRFWEKVEKGSEQACWAWTGAKDPRGDGHFWMNGRTYKAPRVALAFAARREIDTLMTRHSCGHSWCCNPSHIFDSRSEKKVVAKPLSVEQQRWTRLRLEDRETFEAAIKADYETTKSLRATARRFVVSPSQVARVVGRPFQGKPRY